MKLRIVGVMLLSLLAIGLKAQNDPKPALFPQHGEVISSRIRTETWGSKAAVATYKKWIYRVDSGELYFELEGGRKPTLTIGQRIDFRIEKEKVFLQGDKKGKSYRLVGMGKPHSS